jgi:hypothetical protein
LRCIIDAEVGAENGIIGVGCAHGMGGFEYIESTNQRGRFGQNIAKNSFLAPTWVQVPLGRGLGREVYVFAAPLDDQAE